MTPATTIAPVRAAFLNKFFAMKMSASRPSVAGARIEFDIVDKVGRGHSLLVSGHWSPATGNWQHYLFFIDHFTNIPEYFFDIANTMNGIQAILLFIVR
jgi:hypothetical protein